MDWVKLFTCYSDDVALSAGTDAMEVMFTRGIAYIGRAETGGFIPDSQLHHLARKPAQARRIAQMLTADAPDGSPGPWETVPGGFRMRNWDHYNGELDALSERRRNDRERKRRQRERDRDTTGHVTGPSRDGHTHKSKSKKKTAAAAAGEAAAAADLPTAVEILRTKIQAHTKLQALRFDGLTPDRLATLEELIAIHGDDRLVTIALDTCRATPPVHVSAFLGTWAALPAPGQRLRVIEPECDEHPGQVARTCISCAADRLAGDR